MRTMLLAAVLSAHVNPPAKEQLTWCPKRLPGIEAPKARLTGGGMYLGAEKQGELIGDRIKVAGGYDVRYGFGVNEIRWLICAYDEKYIWWQRMDPKTTDCRLQERKAASGVTVKLVCR